MKTGRLEGWKAGRLENPLSTAFQRSRLPCFQSSILPIFHSSSLPALAFLLVYLSFFYRLGALAFVGADEPRYARVAEEMHRGGDYVTPRLEGRPWLEKPPLYYWLASGAIAAMGPGEFSARFPVALSAVLGAGIVWFTGRTLFSPQAGWMALLVLATSAGYFAYGRAASMDMLLTACVTVSLCSFALALRRPQRSLGWFLLGYASMALATLAKGPIGLVLPLLVLGVFLSVSRRWDLLEQMQLIPGFFLFLVLALPWYVLVYRSNGFEFISTFFVNHHLARFLTPLHHHEQRFYYYFLVLLGLAFPWIIFFPDAIRASLKRLRSVPEERLVAIFLWVWLLVPLFFFSLSSSKLPAYILPVLPVLALLLGENLARYVEGRDGRIWFGAVAYPPFAVVLAVATLYFLGIRYNALRVGWCFAALLAASGGLSLWMTRKGNRRGQVLLLAATMVVGIVLTTHLMFPYIDDFHSTRSIVRLVERELEAGPPVIPYRFFHHTLYYYAPGWVTPVAQNQLDLRLALGAGPGYVLTDTSNLPSLLGNPSWDADIRAIRGDRAFLRLQTRQ
ncbi:MAG: glycosyltransferase family 39 protein [Acidobacteria bacterium]|nr:glycosyltransferase family 39 protein [Acidobacteriota bacterium]